MSLALAALAIPIFAPGLFQGLSQAEKDALLSRKNWYVSFEFMVSGQGANGARNWRMSRNTTGTLELNMPIPGQWPPSSGTPPDITQAMGRFITWMSAPTEAGYAAIERGSTNPAEQVNLYYPIQRSVTESIEGGGDSDLWTGNSASFAIGPCMLALDLDAGTYDVIFQVGPTDLGSPIRHEWVRRDRNGVDDAVPAHHVGWFDTAYMPQLAKRNLRQDMKADGTIEFSITGPVKLNGPLGRIEPTMSATFRFSPKLPTKATMTLEPSDLQEYREWRPLPGPNEDEQGVDLVFEWHIDEPGLPANQKTKATKVTFRLGNVSRHPGVCLNWPPAPGGAGPPPKPKPDLKFSDPASPTDLNYEVQSENQIAILTGLDAELNYGEIIVRCYDAGAVGEITAEAELEDGRKLVCEVPMRPGSRKILIPDREEGVSDIAKVWRNAKANGKPDDDDSEVKPVGDARAPGDGLSVWEEYRGFYQGGAWIDNCDTSKKDLFIDNRVGAPAEGGIKLYERITQLVVHPKLLKNECRGDMVVNFNSGTAPHVVDQHALLVKKSDFSYGVCHNMPGKIFPGPPKNTLSVRVKIFDSVDRRYQLLPGVTTVRNSQSSHIAHELLHAVGVYHHGDKDPWEGNSMGVTWRRDRTFPPNAEDRVRELGQLMEVIGERNWGPVPNDFIFGVGNNSLRVILGKMSGQHSGDVNCVMRYNVANVYEKLGVPSTRVLHAGGEMPGIHLCTNATGTVYNAQSHQPQSRYGDADAKRGDCMHQFVISDKFDKEYR